MKLASLFVGAAILGASAVATAATYTVAFDNTYAPDAIKVMDARTTWNPIQSGDKGVVTFDKAFNPKLGPVLVAAGENVDGTVTIPDGTDAPVYFDVNRDTAGGACRISFDAENGAITNVKKFEGVFALAHSCKNFTVTPAGTTLTVTYKKV